MARSDTPQYAALRQAPASSGSDISSIAMSSGDMQRRRIMAARDFGQSDSTSVRSPISNPQLPADSAAISPRSSQRPTRIPPSESVRTISRSSVVFPPPGGERINVEGNGRAQNLFPIPFTSRGIRIHAEKRSSRFQRPRSPPGNRPQNPTRTPPSAVMKPRRRQSDAA